MIYYNYCPKRKTKKKKGDVELFWLGIQNSFFI